MNFDVNASKEITRAMLGFLLSLCCKHINNCLWCWWTLPRKFFRSLKTDDSIFADLRSTRTDFLNSSLSCSLRRATWEFLQNNLEKSALYKSSLDLLSTQFRKTFRLDNFTKTVRNNAIQSFDSGFNCYGLSSQCWFGPWFLCSRWPQTSEVSARKEQLSSTIPNTTVQLCSELPITESLPFLPAQKSACLHQIRWSVQPSRISALSLQQFRLQRIVFAVQQL